MTCTTRYSSIMNELVIYNGVQYVIDQVVGEEPKENGGQQKKYISNKIIEELLQRNQIILFGL